VTYIIKKFHGDLLAAGYLRRNKPNNTIVITIYVHEPLPGEEDLIPKIEDSRVDMYRGEKNLYPCLIRDPNYPLIIGGNGTHTGEFYDKIIRKIISGAKISTLELMEDVSKILSSDESDPKIDPKILSFCGDKSLFGENFCGCLSYKNTDFQIISNSLLCDEYGFIYPDPFHIQSVHPSNIINTRLIFPNYLSAVRTHNGLYVTKKEREPIKADVKTAFKKIRLPKKDVKDVDLVDTIYKEIVGKGRDYKNKTKFVVGAIISEEDL